ncbi:ATP-binding region ATPase domain protein [Gemmatirosa kalamazoonensis]|uniref:histidine kinase n=1 Tax=Gemmatirosa kalamazoonensis TaxID=861299 RepID=W0RJ62_9BACT|nr:ATP-binding protein [Gemmatirosa kalamazoonensis]AHG89458.1 ATP-binding region ATPase domain protein [Gemmatirosa kalamazoonensis]
MTSPVSGAQPPPTGAAVLLVDDHPENLVALEAVLAPLAAETGTRLLRAGSADEALRHVLHEDGAIAVVLLDVMMPGTDGLETARLIRARRVTEHVPIIFVTALDADRRRVTLGYQFGAVDYLTKPLDPEVLRGKVHAFLEIHRRRGEQILHERRRYADEVQAMREAALRDEASIVRTVQRIGTALASELDLERIVQLLTDEATALTDAQFGAFLHDGGDAPAVGDAVVRRADVTGDPRYADVGAFFEATGGRPRVRSYLAVPVRSRTGEVLGALSFGHEQPGVFTERDERLVVGIAGWAAVAMDNARLYAAERTARASAEAAARTKSEFLATMSHEFRTPLNAILGYAQLLEMGVLGPATPAQHAHLERLEASARHLLALVDDVLDVAKVDADRMAIRRDELLTGVAAAAAVMLVQPQATAKGVRLMDLGAGEAGVPYLGDEHRVRQVLVNLISNAVKFTPPGGEVTVACGTAAEPEPSVQSAGAPDGSRGWVYIRVTDTGSGIAPELLEQLFEPFVQGDPALTREHGGTGLGLAISRRLARLMGGDVTAANQPDRGAAFTLWLPSPVPHTAAAEATVGAERAHTGSSSRQTPALGRAGITEAAHAPLDAPAYAVLHALSLRLASEAEAIAERYVAALRSDGRFPGARELPAVQLRDHATPFVGLIASQLMIIGETHGRAPELLRDGAQLQRMMAELHGTQRYRLGWSEADLERETPLFVAEVERALHAAADTRGAGGGTAIPDDAVRGAFQYASAVTRHMFGQATWTALRAHRVARATDAT